MVSHLVVARCLSGCARGQTSEPTATALPPPGPREIVTVMTYNTLDGSGVGPTDPEGPLVLRTAGPWLLSRTRGNRLPRIPEVIRVADPDILGLQDAYLWRVEEHWIAPEVAAELGMNYFIGESESRDGAHPALFTRFSILADEAYPEAL